MPSSPSPFRAALLLIGLLVPWPALALQHAIVPYTSSVDGVTLWMVVIYPDNAVHCPVLAVIHGYSGRMYDVYPTQEFLADRGLFTVGPAMRGRDGSGGQADDSAWEITDIVDAVKAAVSLYPDETDGTNLNVVGYSGGGGNVFGCMSKFPDTFRLAAAFFGMSDYGYDLVHGWYYYGGSGCCQDIMRSRIGGAPEEVPDCYMARSSLLATGNNRYTTFQMYVDSAETLCPVYNDTTYLRRADEAGCTNVSLNLSRPGDLFRWYHGYPNQIPDLVHAFDFFVPGILDGRYPVPVLDRIGSQTVLGYLNVGPYSVVLADGRSEVAALDYDISGAAVSSEDAWRLTLTSATGRVDSLSLALRGLAPLSDYRVEDQDLTHGTERDTVLSTDEAGSLLYRSGLDQASIFRFYRDPAAVPPGPGFGPAGFRLIAFPNPTPGPLCFRLIRGRIARSTAGIPPSASPARPGELRIYDAAGRLVATLGAGGAGPEAGSRAGAGGDRSWSWNGIARDGRRAPAGLYQAVWGAGPDRATARFILVR